MKKKILIVDDEVDLVQMLSAYLQKNGFDVVCAHDGAGGLEKARKEKPAVIVLDLIMPCMPGEEVCRKIRRDAPPFSETPIIMISVKAGDADRIIGRVIGADYYLEKPFKVEDLLLKIQRCLKKKRAE